MPLSQIAEAIDIHKYTNRIRQSIESEKGSDTDIWDRDREKNREIERSIGGERERTEMDISWINEINTHT